MTVAELLERTDSVELSEWRAYFEIENKRMKGEDADTVNEKIKAGFMQFKERL
ncbi:MAG: hypothetical protein BWY57_02423 [Betaproteobacteria bacterium ADurb.Bin341]|jgi:hypothetical protein|nr:MAG: hypothetical protein BWY57_02423 [Betaproteobacteria bacterium ADurb.Bin341]